MQAITAKALVNDDRTLTVQLPAEIQSGEYEIVLVLSNSDSSGTASVSEPTAEKNQNQLNEAWEAWVKEGEDLTTSPTPVTSEYQQSLIEKYRDQGLEL